MNISLSNDKIKNLIFAIFFIEAGLINLFLTGINVIFDIDENNIVELTRIAFYTVIFLMILGYYLFTMKENGYGKVKILLLTLAPAFFAIPQIYNCIVSGFSKESIVLIIKFAVFVAPCYYIALCTLKNKDGINLDFIKWFKWITLLLTPLFAFYILRMTFPVEILKNYSNLGYLNYMSFGYFMLPLFLGSAIDFLFFHNEKRAYFISAFSSVISLICIICSGTRGVILAAVSFCFLALVYALIYQKKIVKQVVIFTVFTLFINLFASYIWMPTGSRLGKKFINTNDSEIQEIANKSREDGFIGELNDIEVETEAKSRAKDIIHRYGISRDCKYDESVKEAIKLIQEGKFKELYPEEIDEETQVELENIKFDDIKAESLSRIPLLKMALEEFKKNIFFGNGFYYFMNKYGTYPHNGILELMCDTGVAGTSIFVAIILMSLYHMRKRMKNPEVGAILLFSLSYTPAYLVSGSIYSDAMITFFMTFGIYFMWHKEGGHEFE